MSRQQTIKTEVTISGVGLMRGRSVRLTLKPATPNHGITFLRTDRPNSAPIKVTIENHKIDLPRCTSIGNSDITVNSIEHLLSALAGLKIDNVQIELDAPEPPALDGSASGYVELLQKAEIVEQEEKRNELEISETFSIEMGNRKLIFLPSDDFRITFIYDHPQLTPQIATFKIDPETYATELAPARTFCLVSETEALKNLGIGKGANDENVLVVDDETEKPQSQLRFSDEFARHKILDLIGDLYLSGRQIAKGEIIALRSGHELHAEFVQAVVKRSQKPIEAKEIYKSLPHRHPFCLLDRVLEFESGKSAVGLKNLSYNEQFFQGHFPDEPIMPGVLQMEALAQLGAWLLLQEDGIDEKIGYFASIKEAKFRLPVRPGDQLRLEIEIIRKRRSFARIAGKAFIGSELSSEGELNIMLGQ